MLNMVASIGNMEKGLFIYEDTSNSLVERKYIRYKKGDLSVYKDKFNDLIGEGIIEENSLFEDRVWKGFGNQHYETFDFTEIEFNQHLYLPLKCFVIIQLHDKRMVVDTVQSDLNYILNMIKRTSGYDKQLLKDFIEFVELKNLETQRGLIHYKHPNLAFIYFNPINDSKDYIETLIEFKDMYRLGEEVREIPTYSNFILFDEIIHDFMMNTTPNLREKYYPIYIWWSLTSVIPIRPIEFIEILNEGIRYEAKEDAYYILIPRRKKSPDPINKRKHAAIQHELKISKEMYNAIDKFRKLANLEREKYLFPTSFYRKFLTRENLSIRYLHYTEHMNWQQMTTLLDRFFR